MDNTLLERLSEGEKRAIADEKEWLDEHKEMYQEAASNLADPAKVRIVMHSLVRRLEPLYLYDPKLDQGAEAPFIIGKLSENLEELLTDFQLVLTFEERRERLRETIANIEEQIRREQSADELDHDQQ